MPHASTIVPASARQLMQVSDAKLASEINALTDWFTDVLFEIPNDEATTIKFPVSRLVLDPERFKEDEHELMSKKGMGVV